MTHFVENVLSSVATTVTGLATTGARVQRGRLYDIAALPALVVEKGSDTVVETPNMAKIDREVQIAITSVIEGRSDLETELNKIASEVYAAIMADTTLGLGYVINVTPAGDSPPLIETGGEIPIATMEMRFNVLYRHSYLSTES